MSSTASATTRSVPPQGRTLLTRWERTSFALSHFVVACLHSLLSLRGLYRFGRCFGFLEWLINYKRRKRFNRAVKRLLRDKFSPKDRRRATREYFMRSRCDKLFYLIVDRISQDVAENLLTIENQQVLDEAMARGHGAYLALSHHGALHVLAMLMSLRGYKTAGVRDPNESAIRRYVQDRFDRRYPQFRRMQVLSADSYPREIYRCFQEGYLLGSAIDVHRLRKPTQKSEEVQFFGEARHFLTGPLRVALRSGAPVLQAFIIPRTGFRYHLEIVTTLIDPQKIDHESEAIRRATHAYAENVERFVLRWPSLLTKI